MRDIEPKTVVSTGPSNLHTGPKDPIVRLNSAEEAEARWIWRNADAVCFDVDSTVCRDEAIDELAAFCGVGKSVAAWTKKAMNGNFSFRQALRERLKLIRPTRLQLEQYLRQNPPKLTAGIRELVRELHERDVSVFLVSGGFTRIILDVAKILDIPAENVSANIILFDEKGDYAGFDENQPTSDSGGKPAVCELLKSRYGFQRLVMVGDGATDLEACPPADTFVGFGGNQVRESVRREAPWFVYSFQELIDELVKEADDDDDQ